LQKCLEQYKANFTQKRTRSILTYFNHTELVSKTDNLYMYILSNVTALVL